MILVGLDFSCVAFLLKNQILPNIKKVENSDCNMADDLDILWVQFCSEKDNILLGVVYIPPENSPYSNINLFDDLENNLIYLKGNVENCKICLVGDFNSRTAEMSDNLLTETRMDSCDDSENELLIHAHALNVCNISLSMSSGDDICNNYGYRFVCLL